MRQVVCGQVSQTIGPFGEREVYVLDIGVVWGCGPGDGGPLALLDLGPPSRPHGHMFSDLRFTVPGHDSVFPGANLRSSKSKDLGWTSGGISPPREQVVGE